MLDKSLKVSKSIEINTTADKLWDVMVNPEKIKLFLYGTQCTSDWKIGSPILFEGSYNGTEYKDKGNVIEAKKGEELTYNYWSGFSGLEDKEENYCIVSLTVSSKSDDVLEFTWTQIGFSSEEGKCHTEDGLGAMLENIKKIAEEK